MVRRAPLDGKEPIRVEDMMKNAGRAVLKGTLSLILTASLVPSQAMVAMAEELNELAAQEQQLEVEAAQENEAVQTDLPTETETPVVQDETAQEPAAVAEPAADEAEDAGEAAVPEQPIEAPVTKGETATVAEEPADEPAITAQADEDVVVSLELTDENKVDDKELYKDSRILNVQVEEGSLDLRDTRVLVNYIGIDGTIYDDGTEEGHGPRGEVDVPRNGKVELKLEGSYKAIALVDDEGTIAELAFGEDQTYTYKEFVVDAAEPNVTVNQEPDGLVSLSDKTIKFTVEDVSLDADASFVEASVAGEAIEPQVESSGNTTTYTVNLDKDGEYEVRATFKDEADHDEVTKEYAFDLDTTSPKVTVEGKTTEGWITSTTNYVVTIEDAHLDERNTKAFGRTINDIRRNASGSRPWEASWGLTFSGFSEEDGKYTFKVEVSSWSSASELVSAVDSAGNDPTTWGEGGVSIDAVAPMIQNAYVTADSTTNSTGATNAGAVFFQSKNASITLDLIDYGSGIKSVTVVDPSGGYTLEEGRTTSNSGEPITVKIVPLNETKKLEAPSYTTTTDEATGTSTTEHTGGLLVTITDRANNVRVWSLARNGSVTENGTTSEPENSVLTLRNAYGDDIVPSHPSYLLADWTAPDLVLSGAEGSEFYNGAVDLKLQVTEANLDLLKAYEKDRSVLTITQKDRLDDSHGSGKVIKSTTYTVSDLDANGVLNISDLASYGDGHFEVIASLTDLANNTTTKEIGQFTIDTIAPEIKVSFDNDDVKNEKYYNAPRTATIAITEHNFDSDKTAVTINATEWSQSQPKVSSWRQDPSNPDIWKAEIPFTSDGTYSFTVSTTDKAGNQATPVSIQPFVIDTTQPTVTVEKGGKDFDEVIAAQETKYEGVSYFDTTQTVTVTVKDRNLDFDTSAITVDGKAIVESDWSKSKSDDDVWTYTYTYTYDETPGKDGSKEGMSYTPEVQLVDLAANSDSRAKQKFVVDLSAPSIDSVKVDKSTTSVGSDKETGDDPIQFYNQDTAMTFNVSDAHRIREIKLFDPEDAYTGTSNIERGAFSGSYTIELKDGASVSDDAEYERDIYLQITDIAGNYRTWTIGRDGKIKNVTETDIANTATINDSGVYPYALIKDVMAPVTGLSGVTAGSYYNSAQTVHATVNEFNFGYLQRFDGSRAVLHITKYEGNAGRAMSTYEIPASSFTGSGSDWAYDEAFSSDGHYIVEASFDDYANNPSNVSRIEEFTIDMTAPVITIEFDNNDVRNGMYYNATRTATITVEEHNFDPSLINIQTTGSIGGWSSSGDTHTCTVFFDEAASHNLTVSGTDLAGNAAAEVSEPEFVVDLTAPKITFGGVAQRLGFTGQEDEYNSTLQPDSAYNGVVAPNITFEDEQNFDTSGTEFTLVGNKVGDVSGTYSYGQSYGSNSETVQFDDFGLKGTDTAYDVNADDIYTINAHMADLAGNEAEGTITFSVNRFGSNYVVSVEEDGKQVDLSASSILDEAPTITVREINVSGAKSEADHSVMKEYANATSEIERKDNGNSDGYRLETLDRRNTDHGWAEYVYTIRSANFGEGSSSDTGDGGQGIYRVNVASDDTASNVNTTADYWSSDTKRAVASAKVGTAEFTLDEVAPVIDETTLPDFIAPGSEYQASFHVTDAITQGNSVEVYVDGERVAVTREGEEVAEGDYVGEGSFEFTIPARSFATRKVAIKVTDYAGRSAEAGDSGFFVTTLIPEIGVVAGVAAAIAGGVAYSKRKKDDGESIYDEGSLLK